ncbi:MAG: hypothetical protein ACOYVJ_00645 [Nitrospirota bacterium]
MNQENSVFQKQPYEKPRLRVIDLTAEEVLAVGCKTTSSGNAPGKPPPCMRAGCAKLGS